MALSDKPSLCRGEQEQTRFPLSSGILQAETYRSYEGHRFYRPAPGRVIKAGYLPRILRRLCSLADIIRPAMNERRG